MENNTTAFLSDEIIDLLNSALKVIMERDYKCVCCRT
jgi:hypothetical protein